MKPQSIHDFRNWFEVLHTTQRSQVAMMKLEAGKSTGENAEAHEVSDQVLLVLKGVIQGDVADESVTLSEGEFVVIPAGVRHRFINKSAETALTFNVYCGPAYPPGTKE